MTIPLDAAPFEDLQRRIPCLLLRDRRRLRGRLDAVRKARGGAARQDLLEGITSAVEEAEQRVVRRRASVPEISYPAALPVSQQKDEILAAIRDHQVVIVAGETGSGKTTQLPKVCLELGRGVSGLIGHTQPRRIAARATADRIAEELGTDLGGVVGYQVRFTGRVGDDTLVKLMTDGILLAEIQGDRLLERYDTLILDEAHERSLNVDFLLGYLEQILPRRLDLKVVITSATIDAHRFSRHFGDAPVIEVSGRTYPVEVRYRPLVEGSGGGEDDEAADRADAGEEPRDQIQGILDAVDELSGEGPGDILVFLSGEREIRDTAEALHRHRLRDTEVLPLYARLSAAEQHRVFSSHPGRRVVLATNVAETSLTVPGIRYVVDAGTARVSRYSSRLKVQRLPIEAISQASANQRAGRCGRTADGICIRLYAEQDYAGRPAFTDPEILRTSLAAVILQMAAVGLGDVAAFPFLDPPDKRAVRDGVQLLEELGALDPNQRDQRKRLTPLGRQLAQLPVDPRLARMVVEAGRNGCVREVLILAAALSIQDPRERPVDKQQAADDKHRRFADKDSDFSALLNLWGYLEEQQKALSSSAFRRLCKAEFLHYLRIREWQDLYAQLRASARSLGLPLNREPADPARISQSLLAGLLSHVGVWDNEKREYAGARGARFAVFPGSGLFRKNPRWVMAAELVETSRLWARVVARIEPEWVEPLAEHLVKRSYSEPHWEKKQGAAMAYEKVTLYGLPIVASRNVHYAHIDPELSRELFLRHALVEGDWSTQHAFWAENRRLLDDVEELESRVRRRDIVVDDEVLFDFYDARIPADVVSARHFDAWWKKARREAPDLLSFDREMLVDPAAGEVGEHDYPDSWQQGELSLALSYTFEPGTAGDGVSVHIPLAVLNRVSGAGFDWQVPGWREELVAALIRSLPKALRVNFVPAPDHARAVLQELAPYAGHQPLRTAVSGELRRRTGVVVPADAWDLERVPAHLRMTFVVEDEQGHAIAQGKDIEALQAQLRVQLRAKLAEVVDEKEGIEREGVLDWTVGALPRSIERRHAGHVVMGYPALVDRGDSVSVRVLASETEQHRAMAAGARRLLILTLPSAQKSVLKSVLDRLSTQDKLALGASPHGGIPALLDDCLACAVDALLAEHGGATWDEAAFRALQAQVKVGLPDRLQGVVSSAAGILALAHDVSRRLDTMTSPLLAPARADISAQLAALVHPGFVTATGAPRLPDLSRYLRAALRRLEKVAGDVRADAERMQRVRSVQEDYDHLLAGLPEDAREAEAVVRVRWMIEELRVSLFAQELRTAYPVSEKRIRKAIEAVATSAGI